MKMMKKKTKMSKKVTPSKKLKKFNEGGINNLKPRTALEAAKDLKINPTIATARTEQEQIKADKDAAAYKDRLVKSLYREPSKVETPAKVSAPKKSYSKTKLLPGGFSSEEQKKSYTQSLREKIKSGMSVDELVKKGYGTKKGLTELGLGKFSEGLAMKQEGLKKKQEGLALKNKAKNTDYKKQWNDDLLNKAVDKKSVQKLTDKEMSYLVRKNGKKTLGIVTEKDNLTSKQKKAFNNVRLAQFERAKPEMRKTLEESVMMMTPRGIAKKAIQKGGEFVFSKGAQEFIKNSGRNLSEPQKLLGQGQKLLGSGTKKAADETAKKVVSKTIKKVVSKTKDPIKGAKDLARNQRSKVNRTQKGGLEKLLKKSDKGVKSKKSSEETILGRTKSQIEAFEKRNKKALDNDWAIIDSYRIGGKANTAKKTAAKVTTMRQGGKKNSKKK